MIMLHLPAGDRPAVREKIGSWPFIFAFPEHRRRPWAIYRHGPSEISATSKPTGSLKLARLR